MPRCAWCNDDPLYIEYHDREWGVPTRDPQILFEFLILEGAQAGLSWITVLRKRERYRQVLFGFDPKRLAQMTDAEIEALALVGEVAQRPDVCIEMDFKHGDIQFLNNRVILHARTDYSDPEDPALKRHLLRLWLMVDSWPPLPQHMRMQGPTDRAGGGIARST